MLDIWKLNLQLFGEGGDGGDSAGEGSEGTAGEIGIEEVPARIPERARKAYADAVAKNKPKAKAEAKPNPTEAPEAKAEKTSYADLIKSDEYKEEHKAYMDKTIQDRFKKYKGIEEENKKMASALDIVANKYGVDRASETFLDDLAAKINSDDSYYEDYAMQHDISVEDAKEVLNLKNEIARRNQEDARKEANERLAAEEAEREAAMQKEMEALRASAAKTKEMYPSFNLETEMQNEKFRVICAATHGDTNAAYWACHHAELKQAEGLAASRQASIQAANTIAANKSRPIENGLSSQASTITKTDWRGASLAEIRAYAAEQKAKAAR